MQLHGYDCETVCPSQLPLGSQERLRFARERQRWFYEWLPETLTVDGVVFEKQWRDRGTVEGGNAAYHAPRANLTVGICLRDDVVATPETLAAVLETNHAYFRGLLLRTQVN